jgi:cytochrome c oxidase subunit 1
MTPEFYLSMVTMHGTIMVFMVLTTAPQGGFGNYVLPIQIGAHDMAFPVLNMLSFWVTFVSLVVMVAALFAAGGAPISGWTAYAPLSALGQVAGPGQGLGQTLWIISIAIFCLGSLLGALNFIPPCSICGPRGCPCADASDGLTWFTTAILALLSSLLLAGVPCR